MSETQVTLEPSPSPVIDEKIATTGISREALLSPDFKVKYAHLIAQEGILLGAGAAAILLQVAEAGVGAGVNEHSNFAYRPADRLRTTMTFVYCLIFGTPEERKAVTDMVTRVHGTVNGTLAEGRDQGKRYDALNPDLQLWVAATLYATAVECHKQVYGDIYDEETQEKIYQEYSIFACSLQVPPEMWPATRQAFWAYWDRKIDEIEVTEHARSVARDLLYLPNAPWHIRMFMPSVRVVTGELLGEKMRKAYGIEYHPNMAKFHLMLAKILYRPMPLSVRSYPVKLYMKDLRERLAKQQKVFSKL